MEAPLLMGKFGSGIYIAGRLQGLIPRVVKNGCFPGINTSGALEGYFVFSGGKLLEKHQRQWEQGHLLEQRKWQTNFERVCVCLGLAIIAGRRQG